MAHVVRAEVQGAVGKSAESMVEGGFPAGSMVEAAEEEEAVRKVGLREVELGFHGILPPYQT